MGMEELTDIYIALFRNYRELPHSPRQMPSPGENAARLEEASVESDIPTEYVCPLSLAIMSDPVYDPNYPQHRFERSWIVSALSQKKQNPLTRTLLYEKDLISDEKLKKQISDYVEQRCSSSSSPNNSGR